MIATLRHFGSRFVIMLSGEALQSILSFGLNIALARLLPAQSYGVFAIIVLIGAMGTLYMRSLLGVAICTYVPQSSGERVARAYAVSFGSGALVFAGFGAALSAAIMALCGLPYAIAAGAFIGAWALRSYIRMALFAQRRAGLATLGDLTFAVTATVLCVPLVLRGATSGFLRDVFFILAFAHVSGIAVALITLRQPVRVSFRAAVRRRFRNLLPSMTWSILSVTAANIQSQGPMLVIAVVAGPAAYAPIAAMVVFLSPLRLAAIAFANMTQPELAAVMKRQDARVRSLLVLPTLGLVLICLVYGAVLMVAFPLVEKRLFAGRFPDAPLSFIAFLIWCIATTAVLAAIPRILLETQRLFRTTALVSAAAASVGIPLVAALVLLRSPAASLFGLFASEFVVFVGFWGAAVSLLRASAGAARACQDDQRMRLVARGLSESPQAFTSPPFNADI